MRCKGFILDSGLIRLITLTFLLKTHVSQSPKGPPIGPPGPIVTVLTPFRLWEPRCLNRRYYSWFSGLFVVVFRAKYPESNPPRLLFRAYAFPRRLATPIIVPFSSIKHSPCWVVRIVIPLSCSWVTEIKLPANSGTCSISVRLTV